MVAVLIGTIHSVVAYNFLDPGFFFLVLVAVSFIYAGWLHPYELLTLGHGILYFLCIPAGYLLLMIYSLCNLHIISWGTREVQQSSSRKRAVAQPGENLPPSGDAQPIPPVAEQQQPAGDDSPPLCPPAEDAMNPDWMKDGALGKGTVDYMSIGEIIFWQDLLKKYLKPLDQDEQHEKRVTSELLELRNQVSFGFWFINFLWILVNFLLSLDARLRAVYFNIGSFQMSTQPLGFVFLVLFSIIILLQIVSMTIHSLGTFMQLISITDLRAKKNSQPYADGNMSMSSGNPEGISPEDALLMTREILGHHSMSSLNSDSSSSQATGSLFDDEDWQQDNEDEEGNPQPANGDMV